MSTREGVVSYIILPVRIRLPGGHDLVRVPAAGETEDNKPHGFRLQGFIVPALGAESLKQVSLAASGGTSLLFLSL